MKIITSYSALTNALDTITPVLNDKLMMEENKNVLFWVHDNTVSVICSNLYTSCIAQLASTLEFAEGEDANTAYYVMVKAKELLDNIKCVSGLRATKISDVTFDIRENEIRLLIHEVAANEEDPNASKMDQVSKFRLSKVKVVERIKTELNDSLKHIENETDYVTIQQSRMLAILEALIPAVNSDARDTVNTRITFNDGFAYVIPQTYAAFVKNVLPEGVDKFIISNSVATFIQSFFRAEPTTQFKKFATQGDAEIIVIKNSIATAVIKCTNANKAFNITAQKEIPSTGIAVNKDYFLDVMKRIEMTKAEVNFKITITEGNATCMVVNKALSQELPVLKAEGNGEFNFTIKPDILSSISFKQFKDDANLLFMYMATDDTGKVTLVITDDMMVGEDHLWHTFTKGLTMGKGDYQWN